MCVQGALSDGEEVESGTSELRDLEFKFFHNLADLQVHIHVYMHVMYIYIYMHMHVVYTCTCL